MPWPIATTLKTTLLLSHTVWDAGWALLEGRLGEVAWEVVCFRWQQYWGSYRGNHELRVLSKERKEQYFYPNRI